MGVRFFNIEQNSDDWYDLRMGRLTTSNLGAVMAHYGKPFGQPARRYAVEIALERITGVEQGRSFYNSVMERGHALEPLARKRYELEYFCTVTNGGFFAADEYGGSPDGLVGDDGVIEIKSVIPVTHYDTLMRGTYDSAYHWQIVGHIEITGREWCDFISYCPEFPDEKALFVKRITRDEVSEDIEKLRIRRGQFLELVDTIQKEIEK